MFPFEAVIGVSAVLYRIGEAKTMLLNSEMRRDYDRHGIVSTFAGIISVVCVGFCMMAVPAPNSTIHAADFIVKVGEQATVLPNGAFDFHYFPDEPICILNTNPVRYLIVVANKTILMQGESIASAVPVGDVLKPSEEYDKQYAGISSVYVGKNSILFFYHGERPTGGVDKHGTHRFYGTIALAVSNDGGQSVSKVGPILTGRNEDPSSDRLAQGVGDVSVCPEHTGKWLYAYYTEHSTVDPATNKSRGHFICMARSKLEDNGRPGSWKKYYQGSFDEPGLGGKDTVVADCWAPNVKYIAAIKKYVMLGSFEGTVLYTSDDGIKWENKTTLFKIKDVPDIGNQIAMHPSLVVENANINGFSGRIFYSYSHAYGHAAPLSPHYFVSRSINFRLKNGKKTPEPMSTPKNESSIAGTYNLTLTSLSTKAKDQPRTMEFRANKTVKSSDGQEGSWEMNGAALKVDIPGFTISQAKKSKNVWKGTLVNDQSKAKFRFELERISD